jgi:prepilin-type N-terminal cleavage/methylation domain-containing protein
LAASHALATKASGNRNSLPGALGWNTAKEIVAKMLRAPSRQYRPNEPGTAHAGFSLLEVLVALTIAAILAVVLTRFASNTRSNANRIRELVTMMSLATYLMEQTPQEGAATSDGRTAGFVWHLAKQRMAYIAVAQKLLPRETGPGTNAVAAPRIATGSPMNAQSGTTPTTTGSSAPAARLPPPTDTGPPPWMPVRVTIIIDAPSGRRYTADTIRLENAADENERAKNK